MPLWRDGRRVIQREQGLDREFSIALALLPRSYRKSHTSRSYVRSTAWYVSQGSYIDVRLKVARYECQILTKPWFTCTDIHWARQPRENEAHGRSQVRSTRADRIYDEGSPMRHSESGPLRREDLELVARTRTLNFA